MQRLDASVLKYVSDFTFSGFAYRSFYEIGNMDALLFYKDYSYKCINTGFQKLQLAHVNAGDLPFLSGTELTLIASHLSSCKGVKKLTLCGGSSVSSIPEDCEVIGRILGDKVECSNKKIYRVNTPHALINKYSIRKLVIGKECKSLKLHMCSIEKIIYEGEEMQSIWINEPQNPMHAILPKYVRWLTLEETDGMTFSGIERADFITMIRCSDSPPHFAGSPVVYIDNGLFC